MYHQNIRKSLMALAISVALLVPTPMETEAQTTAQSRDWEQQELSKQDMAGNNRAVSGDNAAAADGFVIKNGVLKQYTGQDEKITIPQGVTAIGSKAFYNCKKLAEIDIPKSVTSIGIEAFDGCVSLKGIEISKNVVKIGKRAFWNCNTMENLKVDANNRNYYSEDNILYDHNKKLIYCPGGRTGEVDIPDGVTGIYKHAFQNCRLEKVTISGSVEEIGRFAFENCRYLRKVKISNGVKHFSDFAFSKCESLEKINIPKSLRWMGYYTFSGCINLTNVKISEGVPTMGNYTFLDCIKLNSITIPKSMRRFGNGLFENCSSDLTIYGKKGSRAQEYAKENKIAFSLMKKSQRIKSTREYNKTYGNRSFFLNAELKTGDGKLTYRSSNPEIVTVNRSGKVSIKNTGIATITVKAGKTARYNATYVKIKVKVCPQRPKLLTARVMGREKVKISWALDKHATGYKIQYSTDSKFKNKNATNVVTVKRNRTTSVTIGQGLKKRKKYYVRIRSYKEAETEKDIYKLYSAWSKAKTVVCK